MITTNLSERLRSLQLTLRNSQSNACADIRQAKKEKRAHEDIATLKARRRAIDRLNSKVAKISETQAISNDLLCEILDEFHRI